MRWQLNHVLLTQGQMFFVLVCIVFLAWLCHRFYLQKDKTLWGVFVSRVLCLVGLLFLLINPSWQKTKRHEKYIFLVGI